MPNVWIRHWLQLAHNSVANVYGRSHQLTSGRSAILVCDVGRPLNSSLVKLMRVLLVAFVTTVAWRRVWSTSCLLLPTLMALFDRCRGNCTCKQTRWLTNRYSDTYSAKWKDIIFSVFWFDGLICSLLPTAVFEHITCFEDVVARRFVFRTYNLFKSRIPPGNWKQA